MNYHKVTFTISPQSLQITDILIAFLAEIGFESFEDFTQGVHAYIPEKLYDAHAIASLISRECFNGFSLAYQSELIEHRNWNEEWESNYESVNIENLCRIRAPFHKPTKGYEMEIVIEPKMSFGTGHHETTWMMVREIFNLDIKGKSVLDMGCGTGILGIIAEKLGAKRVVAIDMDPHAFENAKENAQRNGCKHLEVLLGDASAIINMRFHVIMANINLNILENDIPTYSTSLEKKGKLMVSGILQTDAERLNRIAKGTGLKPYTEKYRDEWALIGYEKFK